MPQLRRICGPVLKTLQLTDAVEGLNYLHSINIVHGDLKGVSLPDGLP